MEESAKILLDLFIMFAVAKIAGEIFERFRQPALIGELIIGIAIGPYALGIVGHSIMHETVATIGVMVLLFMVGLETKASDIFKVGKQALIVGFVGVIIPFLLGFGFIALLGHPTIEALFIGTALVATSVGITARVLADRGLIGARESKIILAAAVIDDILGMLILAIVGGLGKEAFSWINLIIIVFQALTFVAFQTFVAPVLVRRHLAIIERLKIANAPFIVALIICLGLSTLAVYLGLAAIVGAFLAGMALAETEDRYQLEKQTRPLYEFLVPYFFVVMGTHVQLSLLFNPQILAIGLVASMLAIIGKLIGGLGALRFGFPSALRVGVGMVPRGEVGLIVATVGLGMEIIPDSMYAVVIMVTVITTLLVPPLLPIIFKERA